MLEHVYVRFATSCYAIDKCGLSAIVHTTSVSDKTTAALKQDYSQAFNM